MDLHTLESFFESQEIAFGAILKNCTNMDPEIVRKAMDRHFARTSRLVRNALPSVPDPTVSPFEPTCETQPSIPAKKATPAKSVTPKKKNKTIPTTKAIFKTPVKSPLKRGQVYGGVSRLFGSGSRGSSGGQKRTAISSDDDSAGSPPESPTQVGVLRDDHIGGERQMERHLSASTGTTFRRDIENPFWGDRL